MAYPTNLHGPRIHRRRALLLALGAAWLLGVGIWAWRGLVRDLPDRGAISRIGSTAQSTIVFDASDRSVSTIFEQQRIDVPLSSMSGDFVRALVSVEDQRFYLHGPVDPPRIVAAAATNLLHFRAAQGASTLTQQLARTAFLTSRRTLRRKLQEVLLAWQIERQYSKNEILELYANRVYFGNGLWGVEAASLGYFGRHASQLTLPEAALLAGLVKSPSTFAPTADPQRAVRRRNVVLDAMLDTGAIDRQAWRRARTDRVRLHDALSRAEPHGGYFLEEVRKALVEQFGSKPVYQGGLKVYSTIDPAMQAIADATVASSLKALEERRAGAGGDRDHDPLQAALIALDPQTGYVRALVGGRNFEESPFDRAMQARRQPGSAFKPFVYAAALESGYTQTSIISNLDEPIATPQGSWLPDDGHVDASSLDLRSALRVSSNRAAIRLLQQVGIPRVVQYASAFGLDRQPAVPSLALGSGEVTLASLTSAYAAFASGGLVRKPVLIRRVDDADGRMLMASPDEPSRAMSETTAFLMSDMLADVINAGTGAQARRLGFALPAAGKTGTTNGFNDAWFVGYTPTLVVGVWVGFDSPHTIARNGFAADIAVPIWARFMTSATRGDAPRWFAPPAGIVGAEICLLSGKLASLRCDEHRRRYFASGTQPIEVCDAHSPNFLQRLFGLVEARPRQLAAIDYEPPPLPTASSSAEAASESAFSPAPAQPAAEPTRKRGFWSRVFRR